MRTIKFRGKSKENGEWLYGDVARNEEGAFAILPTFEINSYIDCAKYEVGRDTIGQFTGLYDKNGKEIYEGDILRIGNIQGDVCEVKWNETVCAFGVCFYCENEFDKSTLGEWLRREKNIAIIGNIHDNGKLL